MKILQTDHSVCSYWTRSISSNQRALDQLSYSICHGPGKTPFCIFPYLELHHYNHWPYTGVYIWSTASSRLSCVLKGGYCHERQRKARDCSRFKETKEPLQLSSLCDPGLGESVEDIPRAFDRVLLGWLLLGYNVKFPEFDNCAEALSQKTLKYQGVKGHVVGSVFSRWFRKSVLREGGVEQVR